MEKIARFLRVLILSLSLLSLFLTLTGTRIYDGDGSAILSASRTVLSGASPYATPVGFYYPYFTALALAPISILPHADFFWMLLNLILFFISVTLLFRRLGYTYIFAPFIVFLFPPILWDVNTGQTDIFLVLGLAIFFSLNSRVWKVLGLLLLCCKPQFGIIFIAAILVHYIYHYRKLPDYIPSFIISLLCLYLISVLLDHNFPLDWIRSMIAYHALAWNQTLIHTYDLSLLIIPVVFAIVNRFWFIALPLFILPFFYKLDLISYEVLLSASVLLVLLLVMKMATEKPLALQEPSG